MKIVFSPMRIGIILILLLMIESCKRSHTLTEEEIPGYLPKFEIVYSEENPFDGYIFLRKTDNPGAQFMINNLGKIVWFQPADTIIQREVIPYKESYLALHSMKELYEISYEGDTLLELKYGMGGFDRPLHHEVFKDRKNRIVSLTKESIPYDLSRFGGKEQDTLITDGIIVLSRSGERLWHWSFSQVLDTIKQSDKTLFQIKNDWAHANSLFEDDDGNYLISWRDLSQVWKINSSNGDIMWTYGIPNDTIGDGPFHSQHAIHRNADGDFMVFDNSPRKPNFSSRGVGFNFINGRLQNTLVINLPDSVFTQKEGSVYQYEKDRFLFSIPRTTELIITNRKGDVIWRVKGDVGFYRAYYLDKSVLE